MQITSSNSINYQRSAKPQITETDVLALTVQVVRFLFACVLLHLE